MDGKIIPGMVLKPMFQSINTNFTDIVVALRDGGKIVEGNISYSFDCVNWSEPINLTIIDHKGWEHYYTGEATIKLTDLEDGDYTVFVKYNGNDQYESVIKNATITVMRFDPNIRIKLSKMTISVDDICNAYVIVSPDTQDHLTPTGTVELSTDGINWRSAFLNYGEAFFEISNLPVGDYIVYARYLGDYCYRGISGNTTLSVVPKTPSISIKHINGITYNENLTVTVEGDDVNIIVTLPKDATGIVKLSIDGGKTWITIKVINGTAHHTFKGLKAGEYTLLVKYSGDNHYKSIKTQTSFIVEKRPAPNHKDLTKECMPNTGNPLLILLIALSLISIESLRRKI